MPGKQDIIELNGRDAKVYRAVLDEDALRVAKVPFHRVLVKTGEETEPVDLETVQDALLQRGVYFLKQDAPEDVGPGFLLTPIAPPVVSEPHTKPEVTNFDEIIEKLKRESKSSGDADPFRDLFK